MFQEGVVTGVNLPFLGFGAVWTADSLGERALRLAIPGEPFRHTVGMADRAATEIEGAGMRDEGLRAFRLVAESREGGLHFGE